MVPTVPMGFGFDVTLPGLFGPRTIDPVWLAAVWTAATLGALVIGSLLRTGWRTLGLPPLRRRRPSLWDRPKPSADSPRGIAADIVDLEHSLVAERRRWPPDFRRLGYGSIVAPAYEEMAFRGIPLLLALTVFGVTSLPTLLLVGTAVWALLHGPGSVYPITQVFRVSLHGLVLTYLFVIGLWWVAILFHLINNSIGTIGTIVQTWWRVRDRVIEPGVEVTVTVDADARPGRNGRYPATTTDGLPLDVPGLGPGESARVRVAWADAERGAAFPVE